MLATQPHQNFDLTESNPSATSPPSPPPTTAAPPHQLPLALLQSAAHRPQASFLRTLLSAEKHPSVRAAQQRILIALIGRLPIEHLEHPATVQLLLAGLCRQPSAAGANRVTKALMQRLLPTACVHRLLSAEFLRGRSARFTENALRMVLFALMTFPSTYFDCRACARSAVRSAAASARRVRRAALDVLAVLAQLSSAPAVLEAVRAALLERTMEAAGADGQAAAADVDVADVERRGQRELRLSAAIKARLSRRQLPLVGADGSVQYALRMSPLLATRAAAAAAAQQQQDGTHPRQLPQPAVAAPYLFGADVEWILAGGDGDGNDNGLTKPVSPTANAIKREKPVTGSRRFGDTRVVNHE